MGIRRVTLALCLLELSPPSLRVVEEGSPHFLFSPSSKREKATGEKTKRTKTASCWITGRVINFYHKNVIYSGGEKSICHQKRPLMEPLLTALNFNIWLGRRKGGATCHIDAIKPSLQPVLPCLLWGQIAQVSFPLWASSCLGQRSPPFTGLQCSAEEAVLLQSLVYVVFWVISFSSFPGAVIQRGGGLIRAVAWVPWERWACLELLYSQFHSVIIFK